eukprot:TRINITY_DN66300_c5_g7_i1.p1 TRINITY_DN66300_c5_g7~~TRINITY_DN66300_c5_g7_i1.p1  ORF type:complete len:375 (+),score=238.53 TRINITY_DN66300_c5_g7_i1:23-1147(+)
MSQQHQHRPVAVNLEDVTPATRLLEKKREVEDVQQALEAQKLLYMKKEEHFKRREENLRKKDLELQEALVLFNKFLKENEARRRRDERRANDEVKLREAKEKEIVERSLQLQQLQADCALKKQHLAKLKKYQKFLEAVHEENMGEYPDSNLDRILSRHKTLNDAHRDLVARQLEVTDEMEELRQQFVMENKELHNAHLASNNDIARYQKALELSKKKSVVSEERADTLRRAEQTRTLKLSQILQAVENLYLNCTTYHKRLRLRKRGLNHTQSITEVANNGANNKQKKKKKKKQTQQSKSKKKRNGDGLSDGGDEFDDEDAGDHHNSNDSSNGNNGSKSSSNGSAKKESLQQEIRMKLDVVAHYLNDFKDIVELS